ncbi:MAG TPA: T9SS type A sorting domain-containing protein [bacterium (Candidatus Stahlbacteria)]|nr:T9SS type A sorting domain-containing protein [Candidatus Stahlbacteria bacterium]
MKKVFLTLFIISSLFSYCKIAPWRYQDIPVPFWINEQGCDDIPDSICFEVLQNSAFAWNLSNTFFRFEYEGLTSVNYVAYDGISILYFDETGSIIEPGQGILGVTFMWYSNYMNHWDIVFNAFEFTWSTDNPPSGEDLQSVATHELGHAAGLGHPGTSGCGENCPPATMWYAYAGGINDRTLELDDIGGIIDLHPNWTLNGSVKDAFGNPLGYATLRFIGSAASKPTGMSGIVVGDFPYPMPGEGQYCDTYKEGDVQVGSGGSFLFKMHEPDFQLIAFKWGFYPETLDISFTSAPDTITLTFMLDSLPYGMITGTVLDSVTLEPINAEIFLYSGNSVVANTMTDSGGNFSMSVYISVPPSVEYDSLLIIPYPPYYPKTEFNVWVSETPLNFDVRLNPADLLLVDDDEGDTIEKFYMRVLDSLGISYSIWDVARRGLPSLSVASLLNHPVVIWYTGNADMTLTSEEQDSLAHFLDAGGKLFLTGKDIGEDINGSSFYSDYLHAGLESGYNSYHLIYGVEGDPIGDGLTVSTYPTHLSQDAIYPLDGAYSVLTYMNGDTAAIRYSSGSDDGYRVVYFAFGFEAIKVGVPNQASPREVMERVLGWLDSTLVGIREEFTISSGFLRLYNAYPNPFKGTVVIVFDIPEKGDVSLNIYDVTGRRVRTLISGTLSPGSHRVFWDGRDERGKVLPSGIYFYRLKAENKSLIKSLLKLR